VLTFATNGQLLLNDVKLTFNLLQCFQSQTLFLHTVHSQHTQTQSTNQKAPTHCKHMRMLEKFCRSNFI